MAFRNTTIVFLPAFLGVVITSSSPPCPFSKTALACDCVTGFSSAVFQNVTCQVGNVDTLPKFNDTTGQYSITGILLIEFAHPTAFYIDANSFVDFNSIAQLSLISKNGPMSISWNETALNGTRVSNFSMTQIYHFNSGFGALKKTQKQFLENLQLIAGGDYHLGGGELKDFEKLHSFVIRDTSISTIDQTAFAGLEHELKYLSLTEANVGDSVFPAVLPLQALVTLDLSGNNFQQIDLSDLGGSTPSALFEFDINESDFLKSIKISDINKVPNQLTKVSIKRSKFKSIDSSIGNLLNRANFQMLDISNSDNIICDQNIQFLAKFALCSPARVSCDDSMCANLQNMSLLDYLRQSVENPCK